MSPEFFEGTMRLFFPLFAVALAAMCYERVGIVNVALDGQICIAAIIYTIIASYGSHWCGMASAVIVTYAAGGLLIYLKESLGLNSLLVGLGLLYILMGTSMVLCKWAFGNPGYALAPTDNLSDIHRMGILGVLCTLILLSFVLIRPIRIAKLIGESKELADVFGILREPWYYAHNAIASLLLSSAAIYLVQHGGSFTGGISNNRGFLALAIVIISSGSIRALIATSVLFSASQKLVYLVQVPIEVMDGAPYILAIILLAILSRKRVYG